MACCSGCVGYPAAEEQFGTASAQRDLNSYRRKGPDPSSGLLLKAVANEVRHGDSLLDVGGGVGVLTFELLARGVDHATLVDASSAYLNAAQLEASRRDLKHRLIIVHGDVVHLDGAIAAADVVTMHRVICCYSEWTALLNRATQLSRRLLALSYPRDKWYIRTWFALDNLRRRLFGNTFRTFVHRPLEMDDHLRSMGFKGIAERETAIWSLNVYARQ